jgi:hypothetical protein
MPASGFTTGKDSWVMKREGISNKVLAALAAKGSRSVHRVRQRFCSKWAILKIWTTTYSKSHLRTSLAFNNLAVLHQRLRFLFMAPATSKRIQSTISSESNSCGDLAKFVANRCHTPIAAPLYDIGVLSDRGMLPGLDGIPAPAVLDRLSLLKDCNVRGSHIYIRPSDEHRFTAPDDLNEVSLAKLSADGCKPWAVVGTNVAQTLEGRYDADPSAGLEDVWTAARLYQLETEIQKAGRPLPFRASAQPWRTRWRTASSKS